MLKFAILSDDSKHRFKLSRIWDENKPKVLFIMFNPSTADSKDDDPTIRRCISYAKTWGYGGIWVGNLFTYRTPYPKDLKGHDVYTKLNLNHLIEMEQRCEQVICAWGNSVGIPNFISKHFDKLYYLELSNTGTPKHPLYLKKSLKPKKLKRQ